MAAFDEVLGAGFRTGGVIDKEIIQRPRSGLFRVRFDPDNGDFAIEQGTQITGANMKEDANYTVNPAFEQTIETFPFFSRETISVVDEDIVPVGFRALLGATLEGRVERIRYVWNDASDSLSLLGTEALSHPVGRVAEAFGGTQDLTLGNLRHRSVANPVENEGDSRLRDLSEFSDVFLGGTHAG
jgi:hypothetical protein